MEADARSKVLNLMNQKAKIEEEISRNGDILREVIPIINTIIMSANNVFLEWCRYG